MSIASVPGLSAAASLTASAIQLFRPSHVVMLGITAGREGEVNIGDIIVPREIWDYGAGKWEENDNGRLIFRSRPIPKHLDMHVCQWSHRLGLRKEYYDKIRNDWSTLNPDIEIATPKVHNGSMVSGAAVVNAETIWQHILARHDKIIALDMEAYGVLYAVAAAAIPNYAPYCMVAKFVILG